MILVLTMSVALVWIGAATDADGGWSTFR